MPVVTIEADKSVVSLAELEALAKAAHEIVVEVTGIADVPVYANMSQVTYGISPVELWIAVTDSKIPGGDFEVWLGPISEKFQIWREQSKMKHELNITLTGMNWRFKIGV